MSSKANLSRECTIRPSPSSSMARSLDEWSKVLEDLSDDEEDEAAARAARVAKGMNSTNKEQQGRLDQQRIGGRRGGGRAAANDGVP